MIDTNYQNPWSELAGAAETLLAIGRYRVRDIVTTVMNSATVSDCPLGLAAASELLIVL